MMKAHGKLALLLINIFIVAFPLIFAMKVYTSFTKEENLIDKLQEDLNLIMLKQSNLSNCSTTIMFNVGFSVMLAVLWNSTKVMKIGII